MIPVPYPDLTVPAREPEPDWDAVFRAAGIPPPGPIAVWFFFDAPSGQIVSNVGSLLSVSPNGVEYRSEVRGWTRKSIDAKYAKP